MRTHAIALACLAAASTALAQTAPRIIIEADEPDIPTVGGSTIIRMFAQFDDASDYAIAGIATSLVSSRGSEGWSDISLVAPMDGPGTSAGLVSGTGIDGIIAGQLNFPIAGVFADPSNPIAFWQARYTVPMGSGPGVLDLSTQTDRFDVYVDRDSATSESRLGDLIEGSARVTITPAPATSLALLGLLALGHRRR